MALTLQQRIWCVLEFHKTNSIVIGQRVFKLKFNVDPTTNKSILKWHRNFIERGCTCNQRKGHSGRRSVSEQVVDRLRESFLRSPRKSTRRASRELKVPQSTVSKILRKRLRLHPYKLQLVQKLHPEDKETRHAFCGNLQGLMENDDKLLAKIIFSNEATFHLSGKGNRYNVRIWGSENPHAPLEDERDSKTQCVLCRIKADCVRPVHLWGTNRYWPKVPGNANQLADSTTSCWETWLTFSARWGTAALASRCPHVSQRALAKQMDLPRWTKWPGVLQVAREITGPDRLWLYPLGVREGQSLCTSTTQNCGWAVGTHHCSCQLAHAGYAAESLVRARLSHRCLPSNKRGGTLSVWDTTWNCMILCNCSNQFCKNILVSSDFITTWNQGVFLCSHCIVQSSPYHLLWFDLIIRIIFGVASLLLP